MLLMIVYNTWIINNKPDHLSQPMDHHCSHRWIHTCGSGSGPAALDVLVFASFSSLQQRMLVITNWLLIFSQGRILEIINLLLISLQGRMLVINNWFLISLQGRMLEIIIWLLISLQQGMLEIIKWLLISLQGRMLEIINWYLLDYLSMLNWYCGIFSF